MSFILADRVKDTATSITGTGAYTCAASPPTGFLSFLAGIGDGGQTTYKADDGAGNWEINKGTYTDATKALTRDQFISSSTGSAISWSSSTPALTIVAPGEVFSLAHPGLNRSRFYGQVSTTAVSAQTVTAGTIYCVPIYLPDVCAINTIAVGIGTLVAGNLRFGVYSNFNGAPNKLLLDTGSQAQTAGANSASSFSLGLGVGWYWLALQASSASSFTARGLSIANSQLFGFSSVADSATYGSITKTGSFGSLPNPLGTPTYDSLHLPPDLRYLVT